jgi:uncharacterized protein (TIGR00297 family)
MSETNANTVLDLYILEYKTARDDIRAATDQFYKMTQFGGTAVLAFAGLAFGFWTTHPIGAAVSFGGLLPTLTFFFIGILLGNIAKVARSAEYCRRIEASIRNMLEIESDLRMSVSPRFGWETWVKGEAPDENRQIVWPYACALSFFSLVSALSIGVFEFYFRNTWCKGALWRCIHDSHSTAFLVFFPVLLELVKEWVWLAQASNIARPLRGSLMGALTSPAIMNGINQKMSSIFQVTRFAGASPSGIVAAMAEFGIAFWALRAPGLTILLFVVGAGTIATRLGRDTKLVVEGQPMKRNWRNALANAGIATSLAIGLLFAKSQFVRMCLTLGFVSSLAAALSDTMSHEIGVLYGKNPRSITTLKIAAPGENGGISLAGLLVGMLSAGVVAGISLVLRVLPIRLAVVAAVAGFAGNLVDSLLGATLERRGVLNNDLVNLGCTTSSLLFAVSFYLLARG